MKKSSYYQSEEWKEFLKKVSSLSPAEQTIAIRKEAERRMKRLKKK